MSPNQTKPKQLSTGSSHEPTDSSLLSPEALLRRVNELAGVVPVSQQDATAMPKESGPLFLAPWEAKVFAMVVFLNQQGHFSWAEWVEFFKTEIEIATAAGRPTHGPAYYLLWLTAAEKLLVSKGLLLEDEYARMKSALALEHPHPSIEGLMQEHAVIAEVLDAFARLAQRLESDDGTPEELLVFVDFFTAFVERIHHDKEEDLLFQAMTTSGFPKDGPIAVMRDEHVQGARYLAELRAAAAGRWREPVREKAAQTAHRYIKLLRQHITKEDGDLYPSAHAQLSEESLADLDAACGDYDVAHGEERSRLLGVADDLNRL